MPSEGCAFEKWYGDIGDNEAGDITISVVMDRNRIISADFTGCACPLDITVDAGTYSRGLTTISASFGAVTYSATDTPTGILMNVTAAAAEGYGFYGWTGAVNGTEATLSFLKSSSEPLTARFSEGSSFPWIWVIIGIAAALLTGVLIYRFKPKKAKAPGETQTEDDVPPQPKKPADTATGRVTG